MRTAVYSISTVLVSFFLGAAAPIQAQTTSTDPGTYGQVSIASPTAASLGKFTDIPVGYHTGIPEINVPLYTIKEGSLSLPISLSYHAGGIKVLEPASWVGLNWALNAGGIITRCVMGAPDERGTTNATHGHFSDYGFSNYLTYGAGNRINNLKPQPNDFEFANNILDGEPDLFFFNFNGYSGKFYFSDDRTPVIVDGQDLKIDYYFPTPGTGTASGNIQGFIITVPTGDRYYFGNTGDLPTRAVKPVELTYPCSGYNSIVDNQVYSSYYLNKIVAADGVHTITFTYQTEQYSYYTLSTFPISSVENLATASNPFNTPDKEFALVKNNIDGIRLDSIHFSAGNVAFNASTAARTDLGEFILGGLDDIPNTKAKALANVTITDGSFCKQFAFSYSYYKAFKATLSKYLATSTVPGINTDKTRLRLDKVVEQTCDGSLAAKPWLFHYNGDSLARRLSFAQDHWGFYNGAEKNNQLDTLIPTYTLAANFSYTSGIIPVPGTQVPGANRDADSTSMALGTLTQVTYPTGGSAVFKFEPHDVWANYVKWDYLPPFTMYGDQANLAHNFNYYTFGANSFYKIAVDYARNKSCTNTDPAVALFGFGTNAYSFAPDTVVQSASPTYPHSERVYPPGFFPVGRRRIRLDISSGCDDQVQANISEVRRRNVQENSLVGGLRIKTVTLKESLTAPGMVTSYAYRNPSGHSSGTLYNRPCYVQTVRNKVLEHYGYTGDDGTSHPEAHGCLNPDSSPSMTFLKSPCGIRPMSTTQGSHIGYDIVTVTKPDNGRTEYHYAFTGAGEHTYADVCVRAIDPSYCDPTVPVQPAPPAAYEYDRGQLKYKGDYNGQGQVVKTTSYQHYYDSTKLVTPAYMSKYVAKAGLSNTYERRGYWQTKSVTTETLYSPQGPAFTTTQVQYFTSPFHHQLTRSVQTASNGDTLETRNQYAFDVRTPAPDALVDGNAAYLTACASCDAAFTRRYNSCATDSCRKDAYLDSLLCHATARQQYIAYRRQTFTDPLNTFQTRHDAAKSNADGSLGSILQLQDDGHNELVETSHWKNRRLLGATYTTFGPGLSQPTAMYPAKQFALLLPSPAATFTPAAVSGNSVSRDPRYATTPETTLKFANGNLVEVRAKTGIITSYLWDYQYTLPTAKAIGIDYTTLHTAYNGAGNLRDLRAAPALAHALLTTYIYQPLVGITSQTDPTGRLTTYEYDALGRLLRTRDDQNRILLQQQYHYAGK